MSLSRQFLNLIVDHGFPGVRSLCRIDLTLHQFFHPTPPPQPPNGAGSGSRGPTDAASPATTESFPLPDPIVTFRSSAPAPNGKIDCFPLADGRVMICADQLGHAFRFDAQMRLAWTVPSLHRPKSTPLSLFVLNAGADFNRSRDTWGSRLFVMEKIPKPELGCGAPHSDQFEVFVYRNSKSKPFKAWHCHLLPPPPYVREPRYWHGGNPPVIGSYAVVGGGSHICVSVDGVGTYCLDMASHTWSEVGKWTLPFHGRVEYVPELKLWFGISGETRRLAAAELSAMDSQPQLVGGAWKELCVPEQWKEWRDPQFVCLGSGRICIARFFQTMTTGCHGDGSSGKDFAVMTGVEVVPRVDDGSGGNGKVELQMEALF